MVGAFDRHPLNAPGPFYVVNEECISCGAPELEADGLMSHDGNGHCFFLRQPTTEEETNAAIRSLRAGCCGAVRYGGDDPRVLHRLAELGENSQCDQPPDESVRPVVRNCARFRYGTGKDASNKRRDLREIVSILASSLGHDSDGKCSAFRYWWNNASFRYRWGKTVFGYSVKFDVQNEGDGSWLLRISRHEPAQVSFAISFDQVLQNNAAFRSIQWYAERELRGGYRDGQPHPY